MMIVVVISAALALLSINGMRAVRMMWTCARRCEIATAAASIGLSVAHFLVKLVPVAPARVTSDEHFPHRRCRVIGAIHMKQPAANPFEAYQNQFVTLE
jgi:hypothetical protein